MSSSQLPQSNPSPGGLHDGLPKVAIPRLQSRSISAKASSSKDERRVPVACTACRSHKIRCSGDYPRCKHCENADRECVYVHHRRDRLKIATDQVIKMGDLLKDLRARTSTEDTARINEVLQSVDEAMSNNRFVPSLSAAETVSEEGADRVDAMSIASFDTESLGLNDTYDPRSQTDGFGNRDLGLWHYDPELHQHPSLPPLPPLPPPPLGTAQPDDHPPSDQQQMDNMGLFLDPNEYQNFPFR
ncbi:hypothetical protein B0J11DRAFT_64155 [Dendryphion nanum]|uniref:Zn(2)-C6 fungal-type domain-containing protein n=1 Tax=Dendryphion nanum TaxID=256645 RepID=A0A9P9DIH0_9PLEO|nr:hypothetical protein B0J11DRAFT_64155 [Dendryphion nanum]